MGKETRKRTARKPVTRGRKPKGKSVGPVAKTLSDRDKRIRDGKVRIEEIELLRLQKLFHQANSLGKEYMMLQRQANDVKEKAVAANDAFEAFVAETKTTHELEEWHSINLSDGDTGGQVTFDQKSWEQVNR